MNKVIIAKFIEKALSLSPFYYLLPSDWKN